MSSVRARRNRLRWRCRRGMRELDALLEAFLDEGIADGEFDAFERLLELPDPEIYDCLSGRAAAREPRLRALIGRLRRDPAPFAANGAVE